MSAPFLVSYAVLWLLVGFQTLVLVGMVVALQRLQAGVPGGRSADSHGLPYGSEVPEFRARDLAGVTLTSEDLRGRLTALLFVTPTCSSCHTALEDMTGLEHKALGNVVVIARGSHAEVETLASTYGLRRTVLDTDGRIAEAFDISRVPMAVLVDRNGRIQSYGEPLKSEEAAVPASEARIPEGPEGQVQIVG